VLAPLPSAAVTKLGPLLRLSLEGRHETELQNGAQVGSMILQPSVGLWLDSEKVASEARYSADLRGYPGDGSPYVPKPNHRMDALQDVQIDEVSGLSLHQHAELVGDPTSLSRLAVTRSFGQTTWLQLEGTYHRALNRHDGIFLGYEGNAAFFSDPALQDGISHAPYAWWRRQLDGRNAVGLRARVQLFEDVGAVGGVSYEPGLTYDYRLSKFMHLEVEGGPALVQNGDVALQVLPRGKLLLRRDTPHNIVTVSYERTFLSSAVDNESSLVPICAMVIF